MADTIEERLAKVEQELELLKARVKVDEPKTGWISAITGSFADDPDFEDILRLGKEARSATLSQG